MRESIWQRLGLEASSDRVAIERRHVRPLNLTLAVFWLMHQWRPALRRWLLFDRKPHPVTNEGVSMLEENIGQQLQANLAHRFTNRQVPKRSGSAQPLLAPPLNDSP